MDLLNELFQIVTRLTVYRWFQIDLESDSDIELLVQPHKIHRADAAFPDVHTDMFPPTS